MSSLPQAKVAALTEYQRRLAVRGSLLAWCREAGYEPARHHRLIIKELETLVNNLFAALVRGHEVPSEPLRLMVMTPPGSAKSTYISKLFPPWFLAQCSRLKKLMAEAQKRYDDLGILACTHNGDLSIEFGGAARNLVEANEQLLGYALAKDSRASDAWTCTNGGYYRAGTVGSGISGRRMHLGIVDDFCGKEEDATSKLINDKIWTWWENDFVNRLQPIAARVIIANHRNEDDLCGRLLAKEAGKWRIVRLRLLIENEEQAADDPLGRQVGEYLWPEYFTKEQVEERMANPRACGIQQQEPSPAQGDQFKTEWLLEYSREEYENLKHESHYGASDHAVRTKASNDDTCAGMGIYSDGVLYIHPDILWDKKRTNEVVKWMIDRMERFALLRWWAERENISGSIGPFLQDQQQERHVFCYVEELSTGNKDKLAMAQSVIGLMGMGLVRFPTFAPWWSRARYQLLKFPNGKNDDFVTFISLLGRGVNAMYGKTKPKPTQPDFAVNASRPWTPTFGWLKDSARAKDRLRIAAMQDN